MRPFKARHFTGRITWFQVADEWFDQSKVTQGVRRSGDEIAFDCDYSEPGSPYTYTVSLHRTAQGNFEGHFTGGRTEEKNTGRVVAREYTSRHGFVLLGKWTENGAADDWFAELIYDQSSNKA